MKRKIIHIDEEKCNGCGACANACHESAIGMVNGKAKLLRDDYCDGMGDCLPNCPTGAITFEEREAAPYDAAAVQANKAQQAVPAAAPAHHGGGCPGSRVRELHPGGCPGSAVHEMHPTAPAPDGNAPEDGGRPPFPGMPPMPPMPVSELRQWPCQIKLAPVQAPFFKDAKLLIAADCTAYAYANIHHDFMRGKVTLIGCPKLDGVDYSEKLTAILKGNDIKSVTVLRMEVPCCGGLENAAKKALQQSGKFIPWQVVTIGIDGRILDD